MKYCTCCTGVYLTVYVLSWLLIISKSRTASPLLGPVNCASSLALPAPLVFTVKWVGLFSSTPKEDKREHGAQVTSLYIFDGLKAT